VAGSGFGPHFSRDDLAISTSTGPLYSASPHTDGLAATVESIGLYAELQLPKSVLLRSAIAGHKNDSERTEPRPRGAQTDRRPTALNPQTGSSDYPSRT
jgi:hypothetical protein